MNSVDRIERTSHKRLGARGARPMKRKLVAATIPVARPIYRQKWVTLHGCPGVVLVKVGECIR
jgi:hypothetical protein